MYQARALSRDYQSSEVCMGLVYILIKAMFNLHPHLHVCISELLVIQEV